MKFKCDIPIVTYDTVTVEFDTEGVELDERQKAVIELMKNSRDDDGKLTRQFTDFELSKVMELFTLDFTEFLGTEDDILYGSYQSSCDFSDYVLTVESFEVVE